ncbi:MAG TPA: hypothetical protein VKR23_00590 [Gaiellaceae bacterium]|nr:hypothetical protein [Gaiellaceae bacterium]
MRRGAAVTAIRDLFAVVIRRRKPPKAEFLKRLDSLPVPKPEPRPD